MTYHNLESFGLPDFLVEGIEAYLFNPQGEDLQLLTQDEITSAFFLPTRNQQGFGVEVAITKDLDNNCYNVLVQFGSQPVLMAVIELDGSVAICRPKGDCWKNHSEE